MRRQEHVLSPLRCFSTHNERDAMRGWSISFVWSICSVLLAGRHTHQANQRNRRNQMNKMDEGGGTLLRS